MSASSRHLPGSLELNPSMLQTEGRGTNSLRRTAPTLASTAPFSWPEYGLQNANENP